MPLTWALISESVPGLAGLYISTLLSLYSESGVSDLGGLLARVESMFKISMRGKSQSSSLLRPYVWGSRVYPGMMTKEWDLPYHHDWLPKNYCCHSQHDYPFCQGASSDIGISCHRRWWTRYRDRGQAGDVSGYEDIWTGLSDSGLEGFPGSEESSVSDSEKPIVLALSRLLSG